MDWNVLVRYQHPPSPRFLWTESSKPSHHRNTFTCSLIKQTCWAQWMFLDWIVFPNMSKNTDKFRGVQSATELQALQMAERFCDRSQPPQRAAPLSGSIPVRLHAGPAPRKRAGRAWAADRRGSDEVKSTAGSQVRPTASTASSAGSTPLRKQHSVQSGENTARQTIKNLDFKFARLGDAGANAIQQLWLTCPHSTADHTLR